MNYAERTLRNCLILLALASVCMTSFVYFALSEQIFEQELMIGRLTRYVSLKYEIYDQVNEMSSNLSLAAITQGSDKIIGEDGTVLMNERDYEELRKLYIEKADEAYIKLQELTKKLDEMGYIELYVYWGE